MNGSNQLARKQKQPSPPPHRERWRCPKLATVRDVRIEVTWLYRQGLNGRMAWHDATRAGSLLALAARLLVETDLEDRITALEAELSELKAERYDSEERERDDGRYHIQ